MCECVCVCARTHVHKWCHSLPHFSSASWVSLLPFPPPPLHPSACHISLLLVSLQLHRPPPFCIDVNRVSKCVCVLVSVRVYVWCSLKRQPALGKGALKHNNSILGKNSPRSVGGKEKETKDDRKREGS